MTSTNDHEPRLYDELAAIDAEFPHWHAWHSDCGHMWATRAYSAEERQSRQVPAGVTLDAPTPELLRHEIALYLHQMACAA
jgi:hypothetical protein